MAAARVTDIFDEDGLQGRCLKRDAQVLSNRKRDGKVSEVWDMNSACCAL